MIEGKIKRMPIAKKAKQIEQWRKLHMQELLKNWEYARIKGELIKIEPLK